MLSYVPMILTVPARRFGRLVWFKYSELGFPGFLAPGKRILDIF